MSAKRNPKVSALVVNAIRRLQDVQGSTSKEIGNYIAKEYDVSGQDIRRQVQLAIRRAVSYGILQRTKGGYYVCSNQGTQSTDGEELICAPRKLMCRSKSRRRRKSCACKKSRGRSRGRRSGRKRRGRRGGKRSCGQRKSRSRRSRSRRKSRSRRSRSRKHSRRSCGGKSRSRSRRRSRSRKRSCPRPKRPRRCNDLNEGVVTRKIKNNAKPNNASLSGSRPNSPDGSTSSRSSDEIIGEIRQDS